MKPHPFEYADPDSLDELLVLLGEAGDDAAMIAGGQSLVPLLNLRLARPALVIDLRRIAELATHSVADGTLTAGAMARAIDVEEDPGASRVAGLIPSLGHIGHRQIRSRTTIGGSIAHADPAAELPALLCALDGSVVLRSAARGERVVAAADFLTGPLMTDRRDDEVVVEVRFPAHPGRLRVAEVAKRPGDFAIVGCIAGYAVEHGLIREPRVVVFGASATAARIPTAEAALIGAEPRPSTFAAAAEAVRDTLNPEGDVHASAEYRRHVAGTLVERALAGAA